MVEAVPLGSSVAFRVMPPKTAEMKKWNFKMITDICIFLHSSFLSVCLSIYLYGYSTLDTKPQQLANCLLALAKSTIYKTYLATNSTHRHTPDYQRMFRMRLQYRLYTEMHDSLWANDIDTFKSYWLNRNILGKIHDGKIILSDKI
jgi:hypothetical protein